MNLIAWLRGWWDYKHDPVGISPYAGTKWARAYERGFLARMRWMK